MSFLDKTGLERLWSNIVALVNDRVPTSRKINNKPLLEDIELTAEDVGAAENVHAHDDIYYTEAEIDTKLEGKADSEHNHDASYDAIGTAQTKADSALDSAKGYTDEKVSGLASTSFVETSVNTHNTATDSHNDIRVLINDLTTALNNFLDVDDTTKDQLSEVLTLIENNKGTLESLTTTKVNVADIIDNLTTNSSDKVLSAAQGVAIKVLIDTLQVELDSHTHTVDDVSGVLPLEKGGTGRSMTVTSNAIIRFSSSSDYFSTTSTANGAFYATSENGSPQFGTLPIAQGGTGATTAAAARTNLGAAPAYTYGTADIVAGSASTEPEGTIHFVYE